MLNTTYAAIVYCAIVLGVGFVLGVGRVLFIVPRIGERCAELAEMPIMGAAIFVSAGYLLRRFPSIHLPGRAVTAGLLALTFAVCAELGFAIMLQPQGLAEYIQRRDKVSGAVYLFMLVLFAFMPKLRLVSGRRGGGGGEPKSVSTS